MALFGFGKKVQNKKFDYIPRFYNPEKEELKARIKAYDEEADPAALTKERIKSGFRSKHRGNPTLLQSEKKKSNFRLLSIILILIVLTYLIMKSDKFLHMIEAISG